MNDNIGVDKHVASPSFWMAGISFPCMCGGVLGIYVHLLNALSDCGIRITTNLYG